MEPFLISEFGNPSSIYGVGRVVSEAVSRARNQVSGGLGCQPRQIIFTSGGTESNNAALFSALEVTGKRHVVASTVEHSAVKVYLEAMERKGVAVSWIPVDADGRLDLERLKDSIREDTAVVTVMWANNETGVVYPIREIGEICRGRGVLFHTDAVQVPGKLDVNLEELPVDTAAVSAHKIYGPKGVGALYVSRRTGFAPLVTGGGQESGRRGGTENVPAIVGFGAACEFIDLEENAKLTALRDRLEEGVREQFPEVSINGENVDRLPNTSNITFPGQDAEAMLIQFDRKGICASTGSACTAGSLEPSHVLLAMGKKRAEATASIRFSFGKGNEVEDVDQVLKTLDEI